MKPTKVVRVTFQGHKLWMFDDWRERTDAALIPRHHVDEENECMDWVEAFTGPSFGHAFFGDQNEVRQRGATIGRADEIVDGWPEEDA